jgi:hypothetical protein
LTFAPFGYSGREGVEADPFAVVLVPNWSDPVNTTKLKLISATAGATGVLAMGAISVAFGSTSVAEPTPSTPGPVPTPSATTGETVVEETPAPIEPSTSSAVPEIKGPAPLPPEEEDLPG